MKLASSKADYAGIGNEIYRLREQKQKTLLQCANRDELRKRVDDISMFLREQLTIITEYDHTPSGGYATLSGAKRLYSRS